MSSLKNMQKMKVSVMYSLLSVLVLCFRAVHNHVEWRKNVGTKVRPTYYRVIIRSGNHGISH